ncbi:hypothetical protein ES703_53720 [subsurface metagenome]
MRNLKGTVFPFSGSRPPGTGRTATFGSRLACLFILLGAMGGYQTASGQNVKYNVSLDDYKTFGRKAPMTLGSSFSTLGHFSPLENPADLAFVTDNRIAFGFSAGGQGVGNYLNFIAPNFSISGAAQDCENDSGYTHTKKLLQFSFGFAIGDPAPPEGWALAFGLALNPKSDAVETLFRYDTAQVAIATIVGDTTRALAANIGGVFKIGRSKIELNILDIELFSDSTKYPIRFVLGFRTVTRFGLRLAVQGMPGKGYGASKESILGLKMGLAQSFFNGRLDSRVQLVSFFDGDMNATMQSITGGVGYRLKPKKVRGVIAALLDTEFSYTMSFLAVPNIIGTHMFAIVKYF